MASNPVAATRAASSNALSARLFFPGGAVVDSTSSPKSSDALERARADRARGRPDVARDRVTGYLASRHAHGIYDPEAYLLLGEILSDMHDYARAGAAWLLTERQDETAQKAFAAFRERHGDNPVNILQALKPRAPLEAYPPAVRERLEALKYSYRAPGTRHGEPEAAEEAHELRGRDMGCVFVLLIFVAALVYFIFLIVRGRMH